MGLSALQDFSIFFCFGLILALWLPALDPVLLLLLWPGSGLAALALSWIRPACSCSGPAFGGRSAGGWVDSVRCSIQPRILPFPAWRQVLGGAGLCVRRTVGKTAAFPHGGGFGLVFLFFGVG